MLTLRHFAKVCRERQNSQKTATAPPSHHVSTNTIQVQPQESNRHNQVQLYNMSDNKTEPVPTITVETSTSTGTKNVDVAIARFRCGYICSRAPGRKPGGLWVLESGFGVGIFSLSHPVYLFRLLFLGSPWLRVSTLYKLSLLCIPSSA